MARKCSTNIAKAFIAGEARKEKNTRTDGQSIWLHGNKIMWKTESGDILWALAGWNTPTTRDRINTVLRVLNKPVVVCQIKYEPYAYNWKSRTKEAISSYLPYSVDDFA
jgi:hypothetical protein